MVSTSVQAQVAVQVALSAVVPAQQQMVVERHKHQELQILAVAVAAQWPMGHQEEQVVQA